MSMASYNLLKAAADGLADAINYRTNLKRRRREEEYNYNRDWQRNENEYQRDLQRKKDWLDYTTDYDWKQMEKKDKYSRDKAIRYEKEDIDRKLGYLDELPKDIDLYSPSAVNDYNDVRGAYGLGPVAVQKKEKPYEQILKEKEDELKLKYKYHNMQGQADLARDKALASYRNSLAPKAKDPLQGYKDWLAYMKLEPSEENYALYRSGRYSAPRAVKGGNGAVMEEKGDWTPYTHYNDIKDPWNSVRNQMDKIDELLKSNGYENLIKPVYDALSILQKEGATEEEKNNALKMISEVTKKVDANTATRMKNHLDNLNNLVNYLNRRTRMMSGGKYGFGADEGFYDVASKTAQIDSDLDSYIADEEGKANERNNIASNSMPVQTFNNPYDTRPKSIHIPFDEPIGIWKTINPNDYDNPNDFGLLNDNSPELNTFYDEHGKRYGGYARRR